MNQQQIDSFKAELRQMIETRIERPISQINQRLGHIEQEQREQSAKMDALDSRLGLAEDRLEHARAYLAQLN